MLYSGRPELKGGNPVPPCPSKSDIAAHLYALFAPEFVRPYPASWIEIAYAKAEDGALDAATNFSAFDLCAATEFAEKKNAAGFNIYVGAALRQGTRCGRASGANVLTGSHAWAEFDCAEDAERIAAVLIAFDLRPALVVVTGRAPHLRAHLYFRLAGSEMIAPDELKAANVALKTLLGSDDVANADRVMRLAGTVNSPTEKKRERGYVVESVTLQVRKDAPSYTVDHLVGLAGEDSDLNKSESKAGRDDSELTALLEASRAVGNWHNPMRDAVATMVGRGWTDSAIKLVCAPYCQGGADDPDLVTLIEGARGKWNKPDEDSDADGGANAEIERLARLPLLKYERARIEAAEMLNVRASMLDRLVAAERDKLGLGEDDNKQGRAVSLPEPEPWPEAVDGAELLDGIAAAIRRHVVLSDAARDSTALWVLHTYLVDRFPISPRLGVVSPTKRCGKTTLLDVLGCLVLRPLPTANVTAAAIFRVIEMYHPTMLVDEADTFIRESDELRGVLNSGHRKGGQVLRTVGDDHEPRAFSTYGACAVALIGSLPDQLHDRAVAIELKRKLKSEAAEPFRCDRAGHLEVLARKAARWAKDNAIRIGAVDPAVPEAIINREADNWRPLLAIAEVAGGDWPERARKAAEAAHAAGGEGEAAPIEVLLGDIKGVFAERGIDRITSVDLVAALVGIEGHPWAEMGRLRKPLTGNRLARMLKSLGIGPGAFWTDDKAHKGYLITLFDDAFARFCSQGGSQRCNGKKCDEQRTSEPSPTVREDQSLTVAKCEKPNNDGLSYRLTVAKGEKPQNAHTYPRDEPPGLSEWRNRQLAAEFQEWANAQRDATGTVDQAALERRLRAVLAAEGVAPEFIEIEFERVMKIVFAV